MIAPAVAAIRALAPSFAPKVGLVLGSGLGDFARRVDGAVAVPYRDIPGFPETSVSGHAGQLVLGMVGGTATAVMAGRAHYYENGRADAMKVPVRVLAALGCKTLLLTNASGSLRAETGPGSIVVISDHINLIGQSPLIGESGTERFVDMTKAYDPALRLALRQAASVEGIELREGVYMWFAGPQFETPTEIAVARTLGADLVGMSTVPEVILARHAGLKVGALSIVTNMAAGLAPNAISHQQTLAAASRAADALGRIIARYLSRLAGSP